MEPIEHCPILFCMLILGKTSVHFETDSSLNGRILAQTACTLDKATINEP
jgi:hypothetical protein